MFIPKLETKNYIIGSFDTFINEDTKNMLKEKGLSTEDIDDYLQNLSPKTRASIISKKTYEYIGIIGLKNVDEKNQNADIVFETKKYLDKQSKKEILKEYCSYIRNIHNIKYFDNNKVLNGIIIPNIKYFKYGNKEEVLTRLQQLYNNQIPDMTLPLTIKNGDKIYGIIGLTNVTWSNKSGTLNIFLNDKFNKEIDFMSEIINNYISYVHAEGIHNINAKVSGKDLFLINSMENSKMILYGNIPYSDIVENEIGNTLLYQHIPNIQNEGILMPNIEYESLNKLKTNNLKISRRIFLNSDYSLVNTNYLNSREQEKALVGYIKAMQERNDFTKPLDQDKYFLQRGNLKYGLKKQLLDLNYVLLDFRSNFVGYINIKNEDKLKRHCEIELGIAKEYQGQGLGRTLINNFYDELFNTGYISISANVFDFNEKANNLFKNTSRYNGTRLESYYTDGKYHNINTYTKVNPLIKRKY